MPCQTVYVEIGGRQRLFEQKASVDVDELAYLLRWHRHCELEPGHAGPCGPAPQLSPSGDYELR